MIADIIDACAAEWGVPASEVRGHSRKAHIVAPRHAAMWLAREITGRSMPEIGRAFRRDHTSVLSAIRRIDQADPEMRAAVARLRERLAPSAPEQRFVDETMDRAQIAALGGVS
ncbi:helix-turn-helix domain-containing protein [Limimaricola variabilis]|uniref:helix-turn-helix domain-containing protein n=1 Tax=Limimaricola variabilis TaxID=1492771 RepID=UPI002AC9198B|nr:helix-turn-helix domain-containing protein [Limimaricola variabilis]WPY95618.1 helix-turn-helix domain-containing protein [Limimaricola variabilis]